MIANHKLKLGSLLLVIAMGIIFVFCMDAIPQDPCYHLFADSRDLLSVPNFWNVVSNIPFLIIGFFGMYFSIQKKQNRIHFKLLRNNFVFFLGIFFTGIGSAYYHFHPTSQTLVWDRLPMTISFMAFFSIIIGEFICVRSGASILMPLIAIGLLSIIYWQITASKGQGDLRFYALVQFLPLLLIPFILLMFKANGEIKIYVWLILLMYLMAKFFEATDVFVFDRTNFISGHSIKHIIAAVGPFIFLIVFNKKLSS